MFYDYSSNTFPIHSHSMAQGAIETTPRSRPIQNDYVVGKDIDLAF